MADYPVKVHCPLSRKEEDVYFHPVHIDGKWYVDENSFNGCDNSWHSCPECERCKSKAWQKIFPEE